MKFCTTIYIYALKGFLNWNSLYIYPLLTDIAYIYILFRYINTRDFKLLISSIKNLRGNSYLIIILSILSISNLPIISLGGIQSVINYLISLGFASLLIKRQFSLFSVLLIFQSTLKIISSSGKLPLDFLYPLFCFLISYYYANGFKLNINKRFLTFSSKLSKGKLRIGKLLVLKIKKVNLSLIFIGFTSLLYSIIKFFNYDWISRLLRQNDVIFITDILLSNSKITFKQLSSEVVNYIFSPLTITKTNSYGAFLANQLDPDNFSGGPVVSVFDMIYFYLQGNLFLTILFSLLISLVLFRLFNVMAKNIKIPRIYLPLFSLLTFSIYDYTLFRWSIILFIFSIFLAFIKIKKE